MCDCLAWFLGGVVEKRNKSESSLSMKIYHALYSRVSGLERIFFFFYRNRFKRIDLEKEQETRNNLAKEGYETSTISMNTMDAESNVVEFRLGYDVERIIAAIEQDGFPIETVQVKNIRESDWFITYMTEHSAIEDVLQSREERESFSHRVDYVILVHDPILGVVRLIDGNHKLAEAILDRKENVKICSLPQSVETQFLMPESKKLVDTIHRLARTSRF